MSDTSQTTPPASTQDLTNQLQQIATSLAAIESILAALTAPPRNLPPGTAVNDEYLSGRQFRVNGDIYAPVIPVEQQPGALVK